jgi:hypothetical protein
LSLALVFRSSDLLARICASALGKLTAHLSNGRRHGIEVENGKRELQRYTFAEPFRLSRPRRGSFLREADNQHVSVCTFNVLKAKAGFRKFEFALGAAGGSLPKP